MLSTYNPVNLKTCCATKIKYCFVTLRNHTVTSVLTFTSILCHSRELNCLRGTHSFEATLLFMKTCISFCWKNWYNEMIFKPDGYTHFFFLLLQHNENPMKSLHVDLRVSIQLEMVNQQWDSIWASMTMNQRFPMFISVSCRLPFVQMPRASTLYLF